MNILVTGGFGFIGSHLCNYLTDKGCSVYNIDNKTYACDYVKTSDVKVKKHFNVDIRDQFKLDDFISLGRFDALIHLAAESHVDNSINNPELFASTNVLGTINMLNLANRLCIPRFIQVSTDEVYGALHNDEEPWTEKSPINPNSPYSASKASGDLIAMAYYRTYDMDVRITRCCNNFGVGQHIEKLIPKSISTATKYGYIDIYGDGSNIREWIHAEDHARGIFKVLQYGQPGNIYNIGSGEELSNNEIASMVSVLTETGATINYIEDRKGHDKRYSLNYDKIKNLGFRCRRSIRDSKEWNEMVQYYKEYQKA